MYHILIDAAHNFDPIIERFNTATAIFQNAKAQWDKALRNANKALRNANQLEEDRRQMSTPSLPNLMNGLSHVPDSTNAHFNFIKELGNGTHGQVAEVQEATSKAFYARKTIRVRQGSQSARAAIEERVKREVNIMQRLQHSHIASVLFYVKGIDSFSILMLPVAEYDLRRYLEEVCSRSNRATLRQMDSWFGCLVVALIFAHNAQIKHHDIKPSNILIKNEQPYLADFGSAKDFSDSDNSIEPNDLIAGTPVYYAPEQLPWGRAADVFALGCVFSEMLTVRSGRTLQDYRDNRRDENKEYGYAFRFSLPKVYAWLDGLEDGLNDSLKIVLEQTHRMLDKDPARRRRLIDVKKTFRSDEAGLLYCNNCA